MYDTLVQLKAAMRVRLGSAHDRAALPHVVEFPDYPSELPEPLRIRFEGANVPIDLGLQLAHINTSAASVPLRITSRSVTPGGQAGAPMQMIQGVGSDMPPFMQQFMQMLQMVQQGGRAEGEVPIEIRRRRPRAIADHFNACLLYTSPSPRDMRRSRMPSSA